MQRTLAMLAVILTASCTAFAQSKTEIPANALTKPLVVQDVRGYNSWPMIQAIGDKLVCVYGRGKGHTISTDDRAVYARTSTDNGKTWTAETVVANTPEYGEVAVGKGLDSKGAMLLWVRRIKKDGKEWNQDLYRTSDGVTFERIATPELAARPVQITDIFNVPTVGLTALWFGGDYSDKNPTNSWGTLTSKDDGATWTQNVIESKLPIPQWPTEQSAVYLGNGKILAVARREIGGGNPQFQLTSTDYGATWKREKTNIGDVLASTPSLILDAETGLLSIYYYQRGKGILWRRVVKPDSVFDNPLNWSASEVVSLGSDVTYDAGNANAVAIKGTHYIAFYSGNSTDTAVLVSVVPAPTVVNPPVLQK
jgi:hypothetical protein